MTTLQFIAKWHRASLRNRHAAQQYLLGLCDSSCQPALRPGLISATAKRPPTRTVDPTRDRTCWETAAVVGEAAT
jgi:hypothetical protein